MMPNVLSDALSISKEKAYRWISHLTLAMNRFDIRTKRRKCAFLAVAANESGYFERTQVHLRGLTGRRIQALWPDVFASVEEANMFRGEEQLANRVFANCNGNGNAGSGDGYRFRPRGLIPLCGRTAYQRASDALGFDFIAHPDAMAEDHWAALTAGWYWQDEGFNEYADVGDIHAIAHVLAKRHLTDGRAEFDQIRITYNEAMQVLP